jgi:hypothetical protein
MKPGVKFGLICSGVSVLWSLLLFITGLNRIDSSWIFNVLAVGIPVYCCALAINEYKSTMGGGYIQFNAAFKESVVVTLINSVITAVFSIVYLQFIDPTFMDFIMQKQVTKMQEMGMAEDQIQKMLDQSAKWQSPGMMFFWALLGSVVLGFIIALIMAAIMKKPNPEEII